MNLDIKQVTFDELYNNDNFANLRDENEKENAIKDLPPINLSEERYRELEKAGALYIAGGYLNDKLIGFATVLYPLMPHFSKIIAVCESLFVAKEFRKSRAGIKLIHHCEDRAKEIKSPGLFFSAPLGGALAELLPHLGYTETTRVFLRTFNYE